MLALSQNGALRTWDVARAPEGLTLQCIVAFHAAFSPDGRHIAVAGGLARERKHGLVIIWDAVTGEEVKAFGEPFESPCQVAYSPDGRFIATPITQNKVGLVRVWDVAAGKTARVFPAEGEKPIGPCVAVAYSPDGKLLASAGGDQMVHVWDTATGMKKFTLTGHPSLYRDSPGIQRQQPSAGLRHGRPFSAERQNSL
jgi:WD40 repeat protein